MNELSDIFDSTLIPQGSQLYTTLMGMREGDTIVFSAELPSADLDYVKEGSLTERGAMTSPNFIARFGHIAPSIDRPAETILQRASPGPVAEGVETPVAAPESNVASAAGPPAVADDGSVAALPQSVEEGVVRNNRAGDVAAQAQVAALPPPTLPVPPRAEPTGPVNAPIAHFSPAAESWP